MSGLTQRRRKADDSDEYISQPAQNYAANASEERLDDEDDNKFAKSVSLTLLEEVYLLGLKDSQVSEIS